MMDDFITYAHKVRHAAQRMISAIDAITLTNNPSPELNTRLNVAAKFLDDLMHDLVPHGEVRANQLVLTSGTTWAVPMYIHYTDTSAARVTYRTVPEIVNGGLKWLHVYEYLNEPEYDVAGKSSIAAQAKAIPTLGG